MRALIGGLPCGYRLLGALPDPVRGAGFILGLEGFFGREAGFFSQCFASNSSIWFLKSCSPTTKVIRKNKGGEEEGRQRQDPAPDPHSTSPAVFAIPTSAVIS